MIARGLCYFETVLQATGGLVLPSTTTGPVRPFWVSSEKILSKPDAVELYGQSAGLSTGPLRTAGEGARYLPTNTMMSNWEFQLIRLSWGRGLIRLRIFRAAPMDFTL